MIKEYPVAIWWVSSFNGRVSHFLLSGIAEAVCGATAKEGWRDDKNSNYPQCAKCLKWTESYRSGPPPEGHVDTDEADGLPEDQDSKHFATDEGSAQEDHDEDDE